MLFDLQPTQQWSNTPRDDKAFLPQYTWYGKISDNIVLYCPPLPILNCAEWCSLSDRQFELNKALLKEKAGGQPQKY